MANKKKGNKAVPTVVTDFTLSLPGIVDTRLDLLNWAIGPGVPLGRQVDLKGPPGVGKSTLALLIAYRYLKQFSGDLFYFEGEGKPPSEDHLVKLFPKIDLKRVKKKRPNNLEELLDNLEKLVKEIDTGAIIIDSLSSFGANRGENTILDEARLGREAAKNTLFVSGPFYKIFPEKPILFIVIHQLRDTQKTYVPTTHTPGGWALKHSSSVLLSLSVETYIHPTGSKEERIGQDVEIKIEKNMVGIPFRKVTIPLYYGLGFHNEESLFNEAAKRGIFMSKGGYYGWGEENYRRVDLIKKLQEEKEFYVNILNLITRRE